MYQEELTKTAGALFSRMN